MLLCTCYLRPNARVRWIVDAGIGLHAMQIPAPAMAPLAMLPPVMPPVVVAAPVMPPVTEAALVNDTRSNRERVHERLYAYIPNDVYLESLDELQPEVPSQALSLSVLHVEFSCHIVGYRF